NRFSRPPTQQNLQHLDNSVAARYHSRAVLAHNGPTTTECFPGGRGLEVHRLATAPGATHARSPAGETPELARPGGGASGAVRPCRSDHPNATGDCGRTGRPHGRPPDVRSACIA